MARTGLASAAGKVERMIVYLRGQGVILDNDLARLYEVPTKALVQAVNRNRSRFPPDFMFQLTAVEFGFLRSQFVTSNVGVRLRRLVMAQTDLVRKLNTLERRYDARFKVVFDVIRKLMAPAITKSKPVGFRPRGSIPTR